jgi:HK97 family phage major capsid protein
MTLVAKRAAGLLKLPNDLLRYSAGVAETLVRTSLVARAALTEDLACLEGWGGTGVPLGILGYPRSANDTPTMNQVTLHNARVTGANGDSFDPSDVLKMMALVEETPDLAGASSWVMRPLYFSSLANSRADAVATGDGKGHFCSK